MAILECKKDRERERERSSKKREKSQHPKLSRREKCGQLTLLHFDRLGWKYVANDDVNYGSDARLAASRSECNVRIVEDVTEMEKPQIRSRLGFGVRPRLGPVVPDVCSNGFDRVIWVKLPRLALARDQKRVEMHRCGCRKVAAAWWRRGCRGLLWLRVGCAVDLVNVRGREQGGRFCLVVFWVCRDGGEVGDNVGETSVFVSVRRAIVGGAGGIAAVFCGVHVVMNAQRGWAGGHQGSGGGGGCCGAVDRGHSDGETTRWMRVWVKGMQGMYA